MRGGVRALLTAAAGLLQRHGDQLFAAKVANLA
jgi:hypothetical protein